MKVTRKCRLIWVRKHKSHVFSQNECIMVALYFLYQIVLLNKKSTNQELDKKLVVSYCTILTPYIMTLVRMLKETSEEMLNSDLQPASRVKGFKTSQVIVSRSETVNIMVNLPSSSMYQTFT